MSHEIGKMGFNVEVIPGTNISAAAQGIGVDMKGWDTVTFVAQIAAMTGSATFDMRVVGSANSNFNNGTNTNGTDITNAAIVQVPAAAGVNIACAITVVRPTNRYVKVIATPATNNVNFAVMSILSRGQSRLPFSLPANYQLVAVAEN